MKKGIAALVCFCTAMFFMISGVEVNAEKDENRTIPSKYDLRDYGYVTDVRRQVYGTCYLYAATAAIESGALVSGCGSYDLSEYQIGYMGTHIIDDKVFNTNREGFEVAGEHWYNGIPDDCFWYEFMKGYAIETEDKYPASQITEKLPEEAVTVDGALYLDAYYYAPVTDTDMVKKQIMENGAAFIKLFVGNWFYSDLFYNIETKSAYMPFEDTYKCDHAVVLIGWDDDYSKYNFATIPPGDGAWIIKNSWGDAYDGAYEYTYISYYDQCFAEGKYIITASATNKKIYDRIYQYDGGIGAYRIAGVENVVINFKSCENESITGIRIKPMGSRRADAYNVEFEDTIATISVYKGTFGESCNNNDEPIYVQKDKIEFPGYQTIEFDDVVKLYKNEDYYVKVSFDKPVNYGLDGEGGGNIAESNPSETYIKIDTETEWFDTVKTYSAYPRCNACIKVLTKDREITWYEWLWNQNDFAKIIAGAVIGVIMCFIIWKGIIKTKRKRSREVAGIR